MRDTIQYAIDSKLYGSDKKQKMSIQRLSKQVQNFQGLLNDMISLEIHVMIVSQILDFEQTSAKKVILPLKTNCL